jgi:hypothetical protein
MKNEIYQIPVKWWYKTEKTLNYINWLDITFEFNKPNYLIWGGYISINYIKTKSIFVENAGGLIKTLKKSFNIKDSNNSSQKRKQEKVLLESFICYLVDTFAYQERYQFLWPKQMINFDNFIIKLFIDDYYFVFDVYDENRPYENIQDGSCKIINRNLIDNIHFIY